MENLVQQVASEFGPMKSMLIAAIIGILLGQLPFKTMGIAFSNFLMRMLGKSSAEKVEDKIIKVLVDFINGMETDDDVEIQIVKKTKDNKIIAKKLVSPSGTDEIIVKDIENAA
jgi:hypothetical protein